MSRLNLMYVLGMLSNLVMIAITSAERKFVTTSGFVSALLWNIVAYANDSEVSIDG